MENGTAPASMVTDALVRYENLYGEEGTVEEVVKSNAATAFVAAADTVRGAPILKSSDLIGT